MSMGGELNMVLERLHTAIMYALLQFAHRLLRRLMDGPATLVAVAVLGTGLMVVPSTDDVVALVRRFVFLTAAQTGISLVRDLFAVSEGSPGALRVEFVAVATMLLVLAHALTHAVEHSSVLERTLTLLLYMYTDAVEVVLRAVAEGAGAVLVCVALYLLLRVSFAHAPAEWGLSVIVRGVSMVCINVVLGWLASDTQDLPTRAGTLVLFLFLSDFGIGVLAFLEEVRGYVLWKSAQIVYLDFLAMVHDVRAAMVLGLVLCACKGLLPAGQWPPGLTTALQLTTLVLVNMVLGPLTELLGTMFSLENVIIAFNVVIVVNLCVARLQGKGDA